MTHKHGLKEHTAATLEEGRILGRVLATRMGMGAFVNIQRGDERAALVRCASQCLLRMHSLFGSSCERWSMDRLAGSIDLSGHVAAVERRPVARVVAVDTSAPKTTSSTQAPQHQVAAGRRWCMRLTCLLWLSGCAVNGFMTQSVADAAGLYREALIIGKDVLLATGPWRWRLLK